MSFTQQSSHKKKRRIIAKIKIPNHTMSIRFLVTNNRYNSSKEEYNQHCPKGDIDKIKQLRFDLK